MIAAVVVETAGHVVTAHTVRGRRRICIIDCIAARTAQLRQDDADWQISKHVAIKLLRQSSCYGNFVFLAAISTAQITSWRRRPRLIPLSNSADVDESADYLSDHKTSKTRSISHRLTSRIIRPSFTRCCSLNYCKSLFTILMVAQQQ